MTIRLGDESGGSSWRALSKLAQTPTLQSYSYGKQVGTLRHGLIDDPQVCWIYDYPLGGRIGGLIMEGFVKTGPNAYNQYT